MGCGNTSAHPHHDAGSAVIQLRVPNIPAPFRNCSVATMAALLDGINEACCAHQDCSADGFKLGCVHMCSACVNECLTLHACSDLVIANKYT